MCLVYFPKWLSHFSFFFFIFQENTKLQMSFTNGWNLYVSDDLCHIRPSIFQIIFGIIQSFWNRKISNLFLTQKNRHSWWKNIKFEFFFSFFNEVLDSTSNVLINLWFSYKIQSRSNDWTQLDDPLFVELIFVGARFPQRRISEKNVWRRKIWLSTSIYTVRLQLIHLF